MNKKWLGISLLAFFSTLLVILICTFFGAADITMKDTLMVLCNHIFGGFDSQVEAMGAQSTIIW